MKNLRKTETNGMLVVTGTARQTASIPAGHQLVFIDDDRYLTLHDNQLHYNGTPLVTVPGTLAGVHRVGDLLVVTGSEGLVYLMYQQGGYSVADTANAIPSLSLTEQSGASLSVAVPAIAFAAPYLTWQAPLRQDDVKALTAGLRTAWTTVIANATALGRHYAPMWVRYGVRLWDDTYLWMSDPVALGASTTDNAPLVSVNATVDSSAVTGIPASSLSLATYSLNVTVNSGIGSAWRSIVKAVDVLATRQADLVSTTSAIQYRCINNSGGQRVAVLQYGFPACNDAQMQAQLQQSAWTVVASTTDMDALAQGVWNPGTPPSISLTPAQCDTITTPIEHSVIASLVCNGRLYCACRSGLMTTSAPANPLVVARSYQVTGSRVLGLAAVPRSLYSGGFGRYPVYLFTSEGIYALPLSTQGVYGEPRLLDRTILAAGCVPTEGARDIYFTSSRGHLCRLRASTATIVARDAAATSLAWDDEHSELWCLDSNGRVTAYMTDGECCERTLPATHFYGDITHALAIDTQGRVRDLTNEQQASMDIEWLSSPQPCATPPTEVEWNVYGDDVNVNLDLLGERGMSCHGFLVNRLTVRGRVAAPLKVPVFAPPMRTLRRHITGTAATGTLIDVHLSVK
ncbi:MAG: hypothetical protein J5565_07080 [Muribaculaceae bacterium]|nr:hypothetical protein [Muribaculaceae bacterium]